MHVVLNGVELLSLILMCNLQQCKLNLALALEMLAQFLYVDILWCKIWSLALVLTKIGNQFW